MIDILRNTAVMSTLLRIALNVGATGAIVFGGYVLMKYTVPDKETLLERLPNDLKDPSRLNQIEKDNAALFEVMQQNIKSSDPIWKLKGLEDPWRNPAVTDNSISKPAFKND